MEPWVNYVLASFRHVYGIDYPLPLDYGSDGPHDITIINRTRSFFHGSQTIDSNRVVWHAWRERKIPFLFHDGPASKIIEQRDDKTIINYDIIGSAFYFLSGWHEYQKQRESPNKPTYAYDKSLIKQLEIVHIPVVNYYFDILYKALNRKPQDEKSVARSKRKESTLVLTHDIDSLNSGWLEDGYAALKKGQILSALKIGGNRVRGHDTRFNLHQISQYESTKQIKASYYFLARQGIYNDLKHADYDINAPKVQSSIQQLASDGHEIGIHGSKGSHRNEQLLNEEIGSVGVEVSGGRFHYLHYDHEVTPGILEKTGLQYDSTLGFAKQIGYRNGIAHPFYIFDLNRMKQTQVLEIPLIIMDATLRQDQYMNLSPEQSFPKCTAILDELHKFNGACSILWHNGYFTPYKFASWKKLLDQIIDYHKNESGIFVTGKKLADNFSNLTRIS